MITGEQLINQARLWIDTPFHYQGRKRGVGVDCVGLAIGPLTELGAIDWDYKNYSNPPNPDELLHLVEKHCTPLADFEVGALLLFGYKGLPYHSVLFAGAGRAIQASQASAVMKVVEHDLDQRHRRKIVGVYRLPGVSHG